MESLKANKKPPMMRHGSWEHLHESILRRDEESPLLPPRRDDSPSWKRILNPTLSAPSTSVKSSVFNVVSSMVGGGTLSIPYAMYCSGIIWGTLLLIITGALSLYSYKLLVKCSRRCSRVRHPSYTEVAREALGVWGERVVFTLLFIVLFCAGIAYFCLQGDILVDVVHSLGQWCCPSCSPWIVCRSTCMLAMGFACWLVTSVPSLSALRFSSFIGLCAVILLCVIVVVDYGRLSTPQTYSDVALVKIGHPNFLSISIFTAAYFSHFNLLPVNFELRQPTRIRLLRMLNWSVLVPTALYLVMGVAVYLTYPTSTQGNMLSSYDPDDKFITIGRIGLVASIACAMPLIAFPARKMLEDIIVSLFRGSSDYSVARALIVSGFLISMEVGIAIHIPDVIIIWSFVGATLSSLLSFVFPPLFYLVLRPRMRMEFNATHRFLGIPGLQRDKHSIQALCLLIFGMSLCLICTTESIVNAIASP